MSKTPRRDPKSGGRADPAAHLGDLAEGWTVWRPVCLRGAGFPVAMLERLRAPEAAAAVDRQLSRGEELAEARDRARDHCTKMVGESAGDERKRWLRLRRRLAKGAVADPPAGAHSTDAAFVALAAAARAFEDARREAAGIFEAETRRLSESLRAIGRDPRFREAVTWQNRGAVGGGLDVLLRARPGTRNRATRRHEQLVVNYVQRYCAKNDSIGFFGPIGWAECADDGPAITLRPGPGLVARRRVDFEYWAIEALARELMKDPDLRAWLAPRLDPRFRIEGHHLVAPSGRRTRITAERARLLRACDGESAAVEIAERAVADPDTPYARVDDIYAALVREGRSGALIWTLDVPIAPGPEAALQAKLERIGDADLRARMLAPLDEIEAGRDGVVAAAGDDRALDSAMARLEERFTALTGTPPTQNPGALYGGRTLVYEDCLRDIGLRLGPAFRARLAAPLALVLQSARWFTHALAEVFLAFADEVFSDLERRARGRPVPFGPFWNAIFAFGPRVGPRVEALINELPARWATVFAHEGGAQRLRFSAGELRQRVAAAFAAPHPGWPGARFHSPDIMVAAADTAAIGRGDFLFVVGELHAGDNNLFQTPLFRMHPEPERLLQALAADMGLPRILPVNHPSHQRGQRTAPFAQAHEDLHLGCNQAPSWHPPERVLPLSELVIERADGTLNVRRRDGTRRFHVIQLFERQMRFWSVYNFALMPPGPHVPRITIDDLVVCRETWRFPCGEAGFAREKNELDRFVGARRWQRAVGLPRRVFVRVPNERKPVYVDFESPPSVEVMAKLVRGGAEEGGEGVLAVTEMLPTPEQAWLVDSHGNRYTSELRFVAVDPEPWPAP